MGDGWEQDAVPPGWPSCPSVLTTAGSEPGKRPSPGPGPAASVPLAAGPQGSVVWAQPGPCCPCRQFCGPGSTGVCTRCSLDVPGVVGISRVGWGGGGVAMPLGMRPELVCTQALGSLSPAPAWPSRCSFPVSAEAKGLSRGEWPWCCWTEKAVKGGVTGTGGASGGRWAALGPGGAGGRDPLLGWGPPNTPPGSASPAPTSLPVQLCDSPS